MGRCAALAGVLLAGLSVSCGRGTPPADPPPNPTLSPDAPADQPVESTGAAEVAEYRAAIAPYVEQARKTYPDARRRYLAGLPDGHHFFAVTRLQDGTGRTEQVFITVAGIQDDRITGRVASDIRVVRGFKAGDPYTFPENDLVDWMIARPDGSEEGNVVGKFLDEWQKTRRRR